MPSFGHVLGPNQARFYQDRLGKRGTILCGWLHDQLAAAVYVSLEPADEWIIRLLLYRVPLLYRLRVRDDLRSQGIGTELISAAEEFLRLAGHRRVAVGVDENNHRAESFYRRLGYRQWGYGRLIRTYEETYTMDGELVILQDRCRMFVKRL